MSDTVQLSDQYLLASSLKSDPDVRTSKAKRVVYVSDLNQGSYSSGQITIDATNQLNGSQGFASLKESYLTIPYVITAKNTGTAAIGNLKRFVLGLKAGVWNVVSDLEVEMNGKQILTTNEYKNFWNNLRAQTEMSISDVAKHGSEMLLGADDWYSINFSAAAGGSGDGYGNNGTLPNTTLDYTLGQTQEPRSFNSGLYQRLLSTPMAIDESTHDTNGWASMKKLGAVQIANQHGRGCWVESLGTAAGTIGGTWIYMLKVRLVDLHPLFKELDLVANPQLKIRYRVNSGTVAVSGDATSMKLDSCTLTSGNVCPIMFASTATGEPMSGVLATNAQLSVSFGALQNAFSTTGTINKYIPYSTTRLHIPFYDLVDPRPLISKPVKTVRYLDCFAQYFKGRAGLGVVDGQQNISFNFQLSASLKNVKYIALLPFAETSANHFATANGTEQFASPFDSAPWTCQPGASVRNFQVQIGNQNVFAKTHEYDYENFIDEFSKLGSINGDITREMNNGLIDIDRWTFAHRVMVADCSRITEKDVPSSIQVSGTNSCSQGSNYLILAVYERELDIDRLTGEVGRTD